MVWLLIALVVVWLALFAVWWALVHLGLLVIAAAVWAVWSWRKGHSHA